VRSRTRFPQKNCAWRPFARTASRREAQVHPTTAPGLTAGAGGGGDGEVQPEAAAPVGHQVRAVKAQRRRQARLKVRRHSAPRTAPARPRSPG
jgi:hypothetical protein